MLRIDRFRWAACQLDALENCLEYRTLEDTLASLPKTLDETYARILGGIPQEHKRNAIRILQFLTYFERPLRIEEAVDAIVVDTEGDQYFNPKYRMPDPREISCYCSSLVIVVSSEKHSYDNNEKHVTLQLSHSSVKEYLSSNRLDDYTLRDFQEVAARLSIAKVCLAYLLHLNIDLHVEEIINIFPLAEFCAEYWMVNAAVAESTDEILQDFIKKLFCHYNGSYTNCYSLHRPDEPWYDESWDVSPANEPPSALYYASYEGFVNTVTYLLDKGADVNAEGGIYGTALQAASVRGHEKIVRLLLEKGADVNAQAKDSDTALQMASVNGHEKIVRLLLDNGVDINAKGGAYDTVLQVASLGGHKAIVKLLLDSGADV